MKAIGQLRIIDCLFGKILGDYETSRSNGSLGAARLDPSPYYRVGTIIRVDPSFATVVVRFGKRDISLSKELFIRDKRLDVVAVLRPTGIRTGNNVGMVIIRGEPVPGQEVVLNSSL